MVFSQAKLTFDYEEAGNQVKREYTNSAPLSPTLVTALRNSVQIAPNPTKGIVTASWQAQYTSLIYRVNIESYNSFYSQFWFINSTQTSVQINITSQAAGLYYIKFLLNDGSSFSKSIIKN